MTHAPLPQLAPPGAGIPAIERVVGGTIFAVKRWWGSPNGFAAEFRDQREAIAAMCATVPEPVLGERVLIPRLRGLEDSSRYWSVYMTLEHLRIVNESITGVIRTLTQGNVPPGRVSTAEVKPREGAGSEAVRPYEASCEGYLQLLSLAASMRTNVRYPHPWFGPLDAHGWYAMGAMHMGIHAAQIREILQRSTKKP
jgi:hypothetical protein